MKPLSAFKNQLSMSRYDLQLLWKSLKLLSWVAQNRLKRYFGFYSAPDYCSVAVTWRCPSRCATCGIWRAPLPEDELELRDYKRILSDRYIQGTKGWEMTGGEPLMRDDIFNLTALAFKQLPHAEIRIGTNCLLDKKLMELATTFKHEPLYLSLSIDGVDEIHDKIRGVNGNFKKVMNVIHHLKTLQKEGSPIQFGASVCVSMLNLNHIPDLTKFLESLEIPYQLTPVVFPPYACVEYAREKRESIDFLTENTKNQAADLFSQYSKETYPLFVRFWRGQPYYKPRCYALLRQAQIRPNGDVVVCMLKPTVVGNLKEKSFSEIWTNGRVTELRTQIYSCRECSYVHPNICDALINYQFDGYYHIEAVNKIWSERLSMYKEIWQRRGRRLGELLHILPS